MSKLVVGPVYIEVSCQLRVFFEMPIYVFKLRVEFLDFLLDVLTTELNIEIKANTTFFAILVVYGRFILI